MARIAGVSVMSSPSISRIGTRPLGLRCSCDAGKPRAAWRFVALKESEALFRAICEAREQEHGVW